MREIETLDSDLTTSNDGEILPAVRWWERRRFLYNALLILVEAFISLSHFENLKSFGIGSGIFQTIIANLIANVFYSLGWGVEVFAIYYFERIRFNETSRRILYVLGLLFSLLLAWIAYDMALNY